ncbi:hypothetical protein CFBP5507_04465 [Agrobacterium salinitolerans]|uniref:Uncharacterized protein n=1 Tax=Agrobacterium salinitolerans TaxID=1183413 RepID=A0A4Z1QVR7_9HYPH|nr:hypothetical protein [Agrobacterium salinitolerans]UYZ08267.1 hypothetical protein CFBP5507_04465 [Agrobacterium salinitolerans]
MESRGTTNGAEVNAFAVNEGNFVVSLPGTAQTEIAPTLSLTRRIVARCAAVAAISASMLLTARRRAVATAQLTVDGAAFVARRVAPEASATVAVAAGTILVRRITALSSTKITINGAGFLSWRYLRRATPNRIMRVQPMRALVVAPELRRFIVPRDIPVMRLPRDRGVMP